MTAGKTYIFDEHYRKWAMTSGEWRGGEHFYLPDEFRLSLYTKNSAGELVSVADFQNQPQYGWQAIQEDDDDNYQPPPSAFLSSTVETLFNVIDQLINLFDNAHFFPPGSQHRNACTTETSNACGLGWDIRRDHGRQLRTASYTPSQSGTYYLQVTRIRDDQPVFSKADGWSITFDDTSGGAHKQPVYASSVSTRGGWRNAFPYYEISVEVRGPTLSSASIYHDSTTHQGYSYWYLLDNQFGFQPGQFHYRVGLLSSMTTVTLAVTASNSDATITFSPTDADTSVDGHQINSIPQGVRTVTITVARGSDTEIYTIELASHEQPAMESDQAVRAASSRRPPGFTG